MAPPSSLRRLTWQLDGSTGAVDSTQAATSLPDLTVGRRKYLLMRYPRRLSVRTHTSRQASTLVRVRRERAYSQTLTAISISKYVNIVCIIQVHTSFHWSRGYRISRYFLRPTVKSGKEFASCAESTAPGNTLEAVISQRTCAQG